MHRERYAQRAICTESDFTRTFPTWKSGTKASGVPVCRMIIAGHLEEMFHRPNVGESLPLLLFS